jgi:hypothetical protein
MENLSIAAHWKGTWCERLLKSMYYVTLRWALGGLARLARARPCTRPEESVRCFFVAEFDGFWGVRDDAPLALPC